MDVFFQWCGVVWVEELGQVYLVVEVQGIVGVLLVEYFFDGVFFEKLVFFVVFVGEQYVDEVVEVDWVVLQIVDWEVVGGVGVIVVVVVVGVLCLGQGVFGEVGVSYL